MEHLQSKEPFSSDPYFRSKSIRTSLIRTYVRNAELKRPKLLQASIWPIQRKEQNTQKSNKIVNYLVKTSVCIQSSLQNRFGF